MIYLQLNMHGLNAYKFDLNTFEYGLDDLNSV